MLLSLQFLASLNGNAAPQPSSTNKAVALVEMARPLVIAHRGYSAVAPENTAEAFHLAIAAGADLVELDYHHSKDGIPMVLHDAELDRTTDATNVWDGKRIRLDARTTGELASLDAGRWFHPRFTGARLPRLTDALDLIQSNSVTLIERKAGDAATCVKLLRERGLINQVVVQAFDWAYLCDFHALEPQQVLGALGPPSTRNGRKLTDAEKPLNAAWIEEARQAGARVIVWNRMMDRAAVDAAHQRGLKVWAYTINEPAAANVLLDLGVDGLITDNPALIWRTLALRASARR